MLRKILIGLSLVGIADSIYLTYIKLAAGGQCLIDGSGCETVNTSIYSEIAGIPIAVLGGGAYLIMLAVLLLEPRNDFFGFNGPLIVFGIAFFGVLYSAYLTYLELYVIHAVCEFCVLSAIVLTLMLILSGFRLKQTFKAV